MKILLLVMVVLISATTPNMVISSTAPAWVLLLPPIGSRHPQTGIFNVDNQVPIQQWNVDISFDSARDCERHKDNEHNLILLMTQSIPYRSYEKGNSISVMISTYAARAMQYLNGRCVPYQNLIDREIRGR